MEYFRFLSKGCISRTKTMIILLIIINVSDWYIGLTHPSPIFLKWFGTFINKKVTLKVCVLTPWSWSYLLSSMSPGVSD